jgi:hypothetical protein
VSWKKRHQTVFTHLANAIRYPRAMMIKLFNTSITCGTVLCTERSDNLIIIWNWIDIKQALIRKRKTKHSSSKIHIGWQKSLPCMLHRAETNSQLAKQGCLSQSSKVAPRIKGQYRYKSNQRIYRACAKKKENRNPVCLQWKNWLETYLSTFQRAMNSKNINMLNI